MKNDLASFFATCRNDFPMLKTLMHGKPLVYFDTAATAQKPQIVIDTLSDFYQNHYGTVHRAVYELAAKSTEAFHLARKKMASFLNAKLDSEVIFTRGTTESINLVAYSFGKAFINPGDEVLISEMEHHSNIVPWQMICEDRGAVLRVIPIDDQGEIKLDHYEKLLNSRTRMVAISHMSNVLGTINPIKEMITLAHAKGAKVLIDGAQSAPHISIDIQELDADFFVFSGHKAYGPTGIGVLYAKQELLETMPPYQGGGDMIETVTFEKTTYNVPPLKFEAGTPIFAEAIALGAAIDYLKKLGLAHIAKWEHELLHYATKKLQEIEGFTILGNAKNKGAIITFVIDKVHPLDLGALLDLQGFALRTGHLCAQPTMRRFGQSQAARLSFAFYNTKQEIDAFVIALEAVLSLLR